MTRDQTLATLALAIAATAIVHPVERSPLAASAQSTSPGERPGDWQVDPGRESDIKVDSFLGRQALWLKNIRESTDGRVAHQHLRVSSTRASSGFGCRCASASMKSCLR